jgi:ABC-type glycerol-3-phosphate transport system substrate-binding protein
MTRQLIRSGAVALMATLVAGTAASAQDDVTITHWYYNFPPFADYQRERIESFKEVNPAVTVEYDSSVSPVGEGGFEDKITASLAAGTAPDVFSVISPQAPRIISLGQLAPIDDAALAALGYESQEALEATRVPGAFDAWKDANGTIYGIPDAISFYNLYCNNEHLAAGGIDPETVEIATWDDFLEMGRTVVANNESFYKDENGNWVKNFIKLPMYQDDTWSMQTLTQFLAQTGGSVLSEDGTSSALTSPEAIRAVEMMMTLSRELGDPNIGPTVPGEIHGAVANGEQTCGLAGEWMYGAFLLPTESTLLGNYTAFPLPRMDADVPGNVFWGWSFVVNAASEHKDEAWQYIGHLTADPNGIIENVGIWPPVNDIESLPGVQATPFGDVIAANREGGQHIFNSQQYTDIARMLRGSLELMAFEGADVTEVLTGVSGEIDSLVG